jgi:hypothetical protein
VLVEAQLAARTDHPPQLRQGARLVGHRAQHQHCHGGVEGAVLEGQVVGHRVDHPNRAARLACGVYRLGAQVGLRLDGDELRDRVRVVLEVRSAARADFDHPSAQPRHGVASELPLLVALLGRDEGGELREQRMLDLGPHV